MKTGNQLTGSVIALTPSAGNAMPVSLVVLSLRLSFRSNPTVAVDLRAC
jgi:hypothetical protein